MFQTILCCQPVPGVQLVNLREMVNGSCKRCDTSGGVKKRGRLESSRVKEGGLGRVDFVLLIALLLYLD